MGATERDVWAGADRPHFGRPASIGTSRWNSLWAIATRCASSSLQWKVVCRWSAAQIQQVLFNLLVDAYKSMSRSEEPKKLTLRTDFTDEPR